MIVIGSMNKEGDGLALSANVGLNELVITGIDGDSTRLFDLHNTLIYWTTLYALNRGIRNVITGLHDHIDLIRGIAGIPRSFESSLKGHCFKLLAGEYNLDLYDPNEFYDYGLLGNIYTQLRTKSRTALILGYGDVCTHYHAKAGQDLSYMVFDPLTREHEAFEVYEKGDRTGRLIMDSNTGRMEVRGKVEKEYYIPEMILQAMIRAINTRQRCVRLQWAEQDYSMIKPYINVVEGLGRVSAKDGYYIETDLSV
jgi:hypothetical protein